MNVNSVMTTVREAGFNDAGDTTILGWMNNAYGQIIDNAVASGNEIGWLESSFALSTTSGATVFTSYPTNVAKILGLHYKPASGQRKQIPYLERKEFYQRLDTKVETAESNADPAEFWTLYADIPEFWPAAASTTSNNYVLRYLKTPADLVGSGSIDLPVRYHHLIVSGTLALAHKQDENDIGFQQNHAMFQEGIQAMINDLRIKSLTANDLVDGVNSLGAMRREIIINGANDLADSVLDTFINDAISEFETCYPWEWLQEGPVTLTATAGNNILQIPANLSKPVKLIDQFGGVLNYLNGDKFAKYTAANTASNISGQPYYYTIWGYSAPTDPEDPTVTADGPTFMLYPKPSAAYTYKLWYLRNPHLLVNVDDTVSFNREHRRIIMLSALCKAALATSNKAMTDKYQLYKAEYDSRLRSTIDDLSRPQYDNLDVIDNVDGNGYVGYDRTC